MKKLDNWLKKKLILNENEKKLPKQQKKPKNAGQKQKPHYQNNKKKRFKPKRKGRDTLRVIPLGGLEYIGRNMTVFETNNDIVVIDCGLEFPDEGVLGVDYVIPDVSYLEDKKKKIRAIIITHGHLDHIGALKHVLPKIGYPPIYGSRMTLGLIRKQLDEFKMTQNAKLLPIESTDVLKFGNFTASFAKITHSIPGSFVVTLDTPFGKIVNTGDFKLDVTAPFPSDIPDFAKLSKLGSDGVLMMLADSTNVTIEGFAAPEVEIGETLDEIVENAGRGRLIMSSFASNISRLQQIVNAGIKHGRKIYLSGRSMVTNVGIAHKLGYMKFPDKSVSRISKRINDMPDEKVLILTTGSQGEEFAALTRMARGEHAQVRVRKGDTIVLSSSPIPNTGNDRAVYNMINQFMHQGAKILTNENLDVHTSGHGKREDLRLMMKLIRPKYFMPVHGEPYMRESHKNLALEEGVEEDNIFIFKNGDILEFQKGHPIPKVIKDVIKIRRVYVDGLGGTQSEEGEWVLQERKTMSREGIVMVIYKISNKGRKLLSAPKIISKGFIYMEEMGDMNKSIIKEAKSIYLDLVKKDNAIKQKELRHIIRKRLGRFIIKKIDREPVVVPILIEM